MKRKLTWIAVLYLSQGLPFGLITAQLPLYFRTQGLSLIDIGFMALLTLPWSLKIAWAPLIDRYGDRRHWIACMQFLLALGVCTLPHLPVSSHSMGLWILLFSMAMAAATADIAIDAYAIELLSHDEAPEGNAAKLYGWKGGYLALAGLIGFLATYASWTWAFVACGIFLLALIPITLCAPSSQKNLAAADRKAARSIFSSDFWLEGYSSLLSRPGVVFVLLFILTYKIGSAAIAPMIRPFWVDRGFSPLEVNLVPNILGTIESLFAPAVGAWAIKRLKLFHALWIFGILQVAPALLYAAVAQWDLGRPFIYLASMTESFDISLGQVAFMTFLMVVTEKKYAATQYAFLSCIFGFTRAVAGWAGSYGAQHWGYAPFFTFTFFLGFIPFLFLPWIKKWIATASYDEKRP